MVFTMFLLINFSKSFQDNVCDALEWYRQPKKESFFCGKCGKVVENVIITNELLYMPRILILNLERFEYHYESMESIKLDARCVNS